MRSSTFCHPNHIRVAPAVQVGEGVRQAPVSLYDSYRTLSWALDITASVRAQSPESSELEEAWQYGSTAPTAGVYIGDQQVSQATCMSGTLAADCACKQAFPGLAAPDVSEGHRVMNGMTLQGLHAA